MLKSSCFNSLFAREVLGMTYTGMNETMSPFNRTYNQPSKDNDATKSSSSSNYKIMLWLFWSSIGFDFINDFLVTLFCSPTNDLGFKLSDRKAIIFKPQKEIKFFILFSKYCFLIINPFVVFGNVF